MADFSRQQALALGLNKEQNVAIFGCGGVGSWTAYALCKAGIRSLILSDSDIVSESNLHRTPFMPQHVNMLKTAALADMFPDVEIFQLPKFDKSEFWMSMFNRAYTSDKVSGFLNATVCAIDSLKERQDIYGAFMLYGRYFDIGAEGDEASISNSPATFGPDTVGYDIIPQWLGPQWFAAMVTAECILRERPAPQVVRANFDINRIGEYRAWQARRGKAIDEGKRFTEPTPDIRTRRSIFYESWQ